MKNKNVYTKLVYSFDGELLESQSYQYHGPWLLAAEDLVESAADVDTSTGPSVLDVLDAEYSDDSDIDAGATADKSEDKGDDADKDDTVTDSATAKTQGERKDAKTEIAKTEPAKKVEENPEEAAKAAEPEKKVETQPAAEAKKAEPDKETKTPAQMRDEVQANLEKAFELDETDTEAFGADAAKVLQKLSARAALFTYESVFYSIMNQIPAVIQSVIKTTGEAEKKTGAFFEAWPELNKPEYAPKLASAAQFWRSQNPNAPAEEAIQAIGSLAMVMLGVKREASAATAAPPVQPAAKLRIPSAPAAAKVGAAQVEIKPEDNGILNVLDFDLADD